MAEPGPSIQRRHPLDEKGAGGRIRLEADRELVGAPRLAVVAGPDGELGLGDPVALEAGEAACADLLKQRQSRRRPSRLRDRDRPVDVTTGEPVGAKSAS